MRLHGFYRVSPTYPSPVVPIFKDDTGHLYIQRIDENKKIAEFLPLSLSDGRTIIANSDQYIDKKIGESAIFAIEYKEKSIRSGDIKQFSSHITSMHAQNYFFNKPFSLLEFASLIGKEALIEAAVKECSQSLRALDDQLARKWIKGADFDQRLKKDILTELAEEPISADIYFSFSSTYNLLTNLTVFCRKYLGRYRTSVFREAINEITTSGTDFASEDNIQNFISYFMNSIRKTTGLHHIDSKLLHLNISELESRGNILIKMDEYNLLKKKIKGIKLRVSGQSDGDDEITMAVYYFFFENISKRFIFVMCLYFMQNFKNFPEFIEETESMFL